MYVLLRYKDKEGEKTGVVKNALSSKKLLRDVISRKHLSSTWNMLWWEKGPIKFSMISNASNLWAQRNIDIPWLKTLFTLS